MYEINGKWTEEKKRLNEFMSNRILWSSNKGSGDGPGTQHKLGEQKLYTFYFNFAPSGRMVSYFKWKICKAG